MRGRPIEIDELRRLPVFSGLADEQLATVARTAQVIGLKRGQQLFRVGDPAAHFYYLRSGQLKLLRSSFQGDEKVISVVRPGQSFAEAVLFAGAAGYPVTATAIEESVVLAFDGPMFKELLRASPDTCFRVMAVLSGRLRELVLQIDELTLHNATYRLAAYLLDQLPSGAVHSRDIQFTTPKVVIASRLSIQPETFSRILANLRDMNLVATEGSQIVVRDVDGLRRLLQP